MLRHGVWMTIILAIFSLLTACPHNKISAPQGSLEPTSGIVEHQESPVPTNGLVGRWESLEPTSGLVNILEIQPDGKMKSSMLARVHTRYRVEGDKMILVPDNSSEKSKPTVKSDSAEKGKQSDDQGKEPVVYTFVLENDRLKMTHDASGQVMDMRREDQATAPGSLVGRWSFKHSSGETARMIFDASGGNVLRVPLPGSTEVYYEVKGDVITAVSLDKQHTQSVSYKLEDGKLALIDNKKTTYYVRDSEPK